MPHVFGEAPYGSGLGIRKIKGVPAYRTVPVRRFYRVLSQRTDRISHFSSAGRAIVS